MKGASGGVHNWPRNFRMTYKLHVQFLMRQEDIQHLTSGSTSRFGNIRPRSRICSQLLEHFTLGPVQFSGARRVPEIRFTTLDFSQSSVASHLKKAKRTTELTKSLKFGPQISLNLIFVRIGPGLTTF